MRFENYKQKKAMGQSTGAMDRYEKLLREVSVCPYCGAATTLRPAKEIHKVNRLPEGTMLFVCNNYPQCNTYARSSHQMYMGKKRYVPISSLANAKLRVLRTEAHYYFSVIEDLGIMKEIDLYFWLADKMNITRTQCHFGRFREGNCCIAIDYMLELIKSNQFRIGNKKIKAFNTQHPYKTQEQLDAFFKKEEDEYDEDE